jgi:nucleotidyltransferase substrate binding protein (TIGR01987 family)
MVNEMRWRQRLENFERAFLLLKEALTDLDELSDLEKEGIVQRFEYTFELAWKTLKDYLEYTGINLDQLTPRSVIKQAFSARIIEDGQAWIDMLEQRNLMAHTYSKKNFESAIKLISESYFAGIQQVFNLLKSQSMEK